ncbi:tetratricopeptide repeat protein [Altererythrobacter sp. Z27]|uniref:tetratricopeptide repeat protein n=1 Tax=Altererythrobacter sp. Z27 TaxID=3461147 RepID=UPI0040445E87
MAEPSLNRMDVSKELIMRFAPAAAALSLALAITASMGHAGDRLPDPRAAAMIEQGRAALTQGDVQGAVDAFEAALALDPGHTPVFLELAKAARAEGMQGKAIRYYREALARDPGNLAAISGEGQAMVEKGALEKAKLNLAQIETICGAGCPEAVQLQSTIRQGAQRRVASSEAETAAKPN